MSFFRTSVHYVRVLLIFPIKPIYSILYCTTIVEDSENDTINFLAQVGPVVQMFNVPAWFTLTDDVASLYCLFKRHLVLRASHSLQLYKTACIWDSYGPIVGQVPPTYVSERSLEATAELSPSFISAQSFYCIFSTKYDQRVPWAPNTFSAIVSLLYRWYW